MYEWNKDGTCHTANKTNKILESRFGDKLILKNESGNVI